MTYERLDGLSLLYYAV